MVSAHRERAGDHGADAPGGPVLHNDDVLNAVEERVARSGSVAPVRPWASPERDGRG
jgi:hypothetical protein